MKALRSSLLALALPFIAPAAEPWADARLPTDKGLELWFDATKQSAARQARKLPVINDGSLVDVLLDGSGQQRDLVQRVAEAQPKFKTAGTNAFLRFDGKDDFLAVANLRRAFTNCTVFIVTAPKSNEGYFRGLLAFAATSQRDYTTGFNVDLGATGTPNFSTVNVEGAGMNGQRNLRTQPGAFGRWQVLTVTSQPGTNGARLFVDGGGQGRRERNPGALSMDEFTLGARLYSNTPEPPHAQGFLDGDIAEVLVFSRVLPQAERQAVEKYLEEKHAPLHALALGPQPGGVRLLEVVPNPPAIQMLVPGFSWRELPLELKNLTSIKYRSDGKCYGLGYNGQIWLLADTDGDGAPDKADLFFDGAGKLRGPIGLALTPPGYKHGEGVFVPSKGKLSLIVDKNGDDRADEEIIVATGWKEIPQNVDAIGCALDKDGNIYFSLGAANYANGYLLDADGKSQFDLKSERGTVLKVAPDFSKREIVCTGVRFPVAMAFNRHGDLFCTDQEGATWLPNGNPFDELLHIQPGRHYGFPPRHPKHLPNVFDEPSTFDYGPQHQSTCGLCFNEPVSSSRGNEAPSPQTPDPRRQTQPSQSLLTSAATGRIFGPTHWTGDAIVTGESRGKLYRTKLVKTAAGYVAQNHLLACLNYLTVDACLTPRGDLLVACHTGKPDWGTGPNGPGKLFLIRHSDTNAPQPVLTWSASPTEIRIAFDRPLAPANLRDLAKRTSIIAGKYVMPGDRFEAMWPGYQVVKDQKATPRFDVPVLSASVTPDRRNIILHTAPRTAAVNYAVRMPNVSRNAERGMRNAESGAAFSVAPGFNRVSSEADGTNRSNGFPPATTANTGLKPGANEKPELDDDIELLVDNHGVEGKWTSKDGKESWNGWLPHLDTQVSRELTVGSAEHELLWQRLQKHGSFSMNAKLDLHAMLQPSVQSGSKLDYEPERERVHILTVTDNLGSFSSHELEGGIGVTSGSTRWGRSAWSRLEWFSCSAGFNVWEGWAPFLKLSWSVEPNSGISRPFPLRRFYLPWAEPKAEPAPLATERVVPELAGGRWLAGRRLFHSEQLACAKCHRVRGEGTAVGPDLSNLLHRDYASVLRDIREPSAAINPDHPAFNVDLTDGESLTGVVVGESAAELRLADATGKTVVLPRAKVKSLRASTLSLMPEGLLASLNAEQVRDLMTFLLTVPLEPAPIEGNTPPPPPRKRAEVVALLGVPASAGSVGSSKGAFLSKPEPAKAGTPNLHVVLCAGPKDHGKGEHDYPLWQRRWSRLLPLADNVTVSTADKWPSAEQFAKASVICFFNNNPVWNEERGKELDAYLARGGGAAYFHWAVEARTNALAFARRIGLASDSSKLKYRHGPIDFVFHEHPLARGFTATSFTREKFVDETYWNFQGDPKDVQLLASAPEDGKLTPQLWTRQVGKGRVFVAVPGHYNWTFDDPVFRVLALRGICWAAGQSEDRLAELATIGARIAD
jgi:putative heme-binding domain-containing protein